jgi:hypothetical protein
VRARSGQARQHWLVSITRLSLWSSHAQQQRGIMMTSLQSIPTAIALTGLLIGASNSLAGDDIPNLVGTWKVQSEAAEIMMGTRPTAKSIASGDFQQNAFEIIFTEQQGRLLHGVTKSTSVTEKMVCAINYDNVGLHCTDEDGVREAKIVNNDKIVFHYHHVTPEESVVAVGVMTRQP